jgi:predicted ATPase
MGPSVSPKLVEFVLSVDVEPAIRVAAAMGIVHECGRGDFAFEHDGIQSAAYAMIPDSERELFHLEIGRRMWRRLGEDDLDLHLFVLLSQLSIGRRLITREREKVAVSTLCLDAGIKAARYSTFRIAFSYFEFGLSLLDDDAWRQHYDLTLALHNSGAEMAVCTSNFERADELIDAVLKRAKFLTDKTRAFATRVYRLAAESKQKEAIETGFEVLETLGEPIPRRFCRRAARKEFKGVRKLLQGKSDEQLLRMPVMKDKCKLVCLQILSSNHISALLAQPHYLPFITLKMMKITMKNGASVFSASSFGAYGMLLLSVRHDVQAAFRYGTLAEKFLSRFGAKEYAPRVHAAFFGCICAWRRPVKEVVQPLLDGYKIGMQTGDLDGAFMCANLYCLNAMEAGAPIPVVEREWDQISESMLLTRYQAFLKMALNNLQVLHHLSGRTEDPLGSCGDVIDFDVEMINAKDRNDYVYIFTLSICRLFLCYMFNDLDGAAKHLGAFRHLNKVPPSLRKLTCIFFGGLVVLACARDGRKPRRNLRLARWIIKAVDRLATLSPSNCLDKLFLLEAEYASVRGQHDAAHKKYTCAVALAKESSFLQTTALGYELWARHLHRTGDHSLSRKYFSEAVKWYREYGALRKVEHLERDIEERFSGNSDLP